MADKARRVKSIPLGKAVIRTGAVRRPDLGYLLVGDLKRERQEIAHALFFKWQAGTFMKGSLNFNAHTCCDVKVPQQALIVMSWQGNYGIAFVGESHFSNIFQDGWPPPPGPRYGGIRSVAEVAGKAYAVGQEGTVYRLDQFPVWTRIDDGLPVSFDIEAIHGFSESDLYAVGFRGKMWRFDGRKWSRRALPTKATLNSVKCAPGGEVFVAGHDGTLIRGSQDTWEVVEHGKTDDDIWDLEWFDGRLYVSTMYDLYQLEGDTLEAVDFGPDAPKTCYHLSAAEGVLWSIGEEDVMSFDGDKWSRVV